MLQMTRYMQGVDRVGFDNGGMGKTKGQFIEEQKIREEFMEKMKRGPQAMEMNMKLNDPGLFGRIRNVLNFQWMMSYFSTHKKK